MAKRLAMEIGYRYIDSGAMYRAVTLYALRNGIISQDGNIDSRRLIESLPEIKIDFDVSDGTGQRTLLNGDDVESEIREMNVSRFVSVIAAVPEVRTAMVGQQRSLGKDGGVVMDGRDIGTTVFPDAGLKVFVTASPEVRAERRYLELKAKGEDVDFQEVLRNVCERDHLDETRDVSPLRKAPGAKVLDNTCLTPDQQNHILLRWVREVLPENFRH